MNTGHWRSALEMRGHQCYEKVMKKILIGCAALMALVLGTRGGDSAWSNNRLFFRDDGEPDYARVFLPTPVPAESAIANQTSARERELQAQLDRARAERDGAMNWIIGNLSGRIAVPAAMVDTVDTPVFDDQMQLHPDLKKLVRATDLEASSINEGLASALQEARTLWSGIIRPVHVSPDAWVVTVPPHEADGEAIRARLMDSITAAIGPARAGLFWRAAARDLNRTFIYFGAGARVIHCTYLASTEGVEGIRIRDELITADESGMRRIEAIEFEASEVPEAYVYFNRVAESAFISK